MERRAQFNLAYLLFALIAMLALQQWWQRAQTVEVVPYSEFEKLLAEHRIDEVVISDQRITGKFKSAEGGKTVAVANLVPPDLPSGCQSTTSSTPASTKAPSCATCSPGSCRR